MKRECMKIYFACSITGGREFESNYQEIVKALLADGHDVPTWHLANSELVRNEENLSPQHVYERDTGWIRECDMLIAEVGTPSHGVGYEIGYALNWGKPVICLCQKTVRVSKMISGNLQLQAGFIHYDTIQDCVKQLRERLAA